MAKKDDPPPDAFEDDGWDFGPPSARRSSLRPGVRRSLRPAAEAVRAVEVQRKDDARRIVDNFVESGWSEPPQADDEPTLIAATNAVAAALAGSTVIHESPVVVAAPPAAEPEAPAALEPAVSVAPAPSPEPAVPVAPAASAAPAARRAAVRPAATRTGPQPSLSRSARPRGATPISFPAEARPSVPALSIPAAAKASTPAAASLSVPADSSIPASAASAASVSMSAAAAPAVAVSEPAPASVAPSPLAAVPAPSIAIASDPPLAEATDNEPDSVSGARLVHPSRRAPSATASFHPVVPDIASARPMPRQAFSPINVLPLASLVLSTMGIGFLMFGGSPSAEATTASRAEPAAATAPAPVIAKAPERAAPAAPGPKKLEELPAAPAAAAVEAADTVKVELTVFPYDAAVGYLGNQQKGGPVYSFDVPKGKSIAVEVAHKGYGTRKVTLDGTQTKLWIGLRKKTQE